MTWAKGRHSTTEPPRCPRSGNFEMENVALLSWSSRGISLHLRCLVSICKLKNTPVDVPTSQLCQDQSESTFVEELCKLWNAVQRASMKTLENCRLTENSSLEMGVAKGLWWFGSTHRVKLPNSDSGPTYKVTFTMDPPSYSRHPGRKCDWQENYREEKKNFKFIFVSFF